MGLQSLTLKRCQISTIGEREPRTIVYSASLQVLDIAYNRISQWALFDSLEAIYPALNSLVITGNPLYSGLSSAEGTTLTAEDGYMLTIARLPRIDFLNHSKITEKERLNSETYYLNQIASELTKTPAGKRQQVLHRHPRWNALCDEYGEPAPPEAKSNDIKPNSLAARLVTITFRADATPGYAFSTWQEVVTKSTNVYSLLGIAGRRLKTMPLKLRLILETGEHDPIGSDAGYAGPDWWDSSDEEDDRPRAGQEFVAREIELVAGTRPIGTYIEGRDAHIRVEVNGNP